MTDASGIGVIRVKDGVDFSVIAPAGFRILSAIDQVSESLGMDLTVTSACDGTHSGPADPHHTGEAYDIRTHDFPNDTLKQQVLGAIMNKLGTDRFFGWIEDADQPNEHIHLQRRKDTVYP